MTWNYIFSCVQAHLCHILIDVFARIDKVIIYVQGKKDFQNIGNKRVSMRWWLCTSSGNKQSLGLLLDTSVGVYQPFVHSCLPIMLSSMCLIFGSSWLVQVFQLCIFLMECWNILCMLSTHYWKLHIQLPHNQRQVHFVLSMDIIIVLNLLCCLGRNSCVLNVHSYLKLQVVTIIYEDVG